MKHFLVCTLLFVGLQGCGQQQTGPSDGQPLARVNKSASDIPVYDEAKHGTPMDPANMTKNALQVWEKIDPAPQIEAYKEETGDYPRDYAEFKSGVLEPNDIKFPENMPGGLIFAYDEANHKVVLVVQAN